MAINIVDILDISPLEVIQLVEKEKYITATEILGSPETYREFRNNLDTFVGNLSEGTIVQSVTGYREFLKGCSSVTVGFNEKKSLTLDVPELPEFQTSGFLLTFTAENTEGTTYYRILVERKAYGRLLTVAELVYSDYYYFNYCTDVVMKFSGKSLTDNENSAKYPCIIAAMAYVFGEEQEILEDSVVGYWFASQLLILVSKLNGTPVPTSEPLNSGRFKPNIVGVTDNPSTKVTSKLEVSIPQVIGSKSSEPTSVHDLRFIDAGGYGFESELISHFMRVKSKQSNVILERLVEAPDRQHNYFVVYESVALAEPDIRIDRESAKKSNYLLKKVFQVHKTSGSIICLVLAECFKVKDLYDGGAINTEYLDSMDSSSKYKETQQLEFDHLCNFFYQVPNEFCSYYTLKVKPGTIDADSKSVTKVLHYLDSAPIMINPMLNRYVIV